MVLTLPGNIYFLVACGVAILYEIYRQNKNETENIKKQFFIGAAPIFFMGAITTGYLLSIYEDLQQGLDTYRIYVNKIGDSGTMEGIFSTQFTFNHFLGIFEN